MARRIGGWVVLAAFVIVAPIACATREPIVGVGSAASSIAPQPDAGGPSAFDAAPSSPDSAHDAALALVECDPNADPPYGCDWEKQACVAGKCVDCPDGFEAMSTACERRCRLDKECARGEICSYISPAYSFCTPKPPVPKCAKGEIALKTGTCFTPCKTNADCVKVNPDFCCRGDPNAPTTICMGRCP